MIVGNPVGHPVGYPVGHAATISLINVRVHGMTHTYENIPLRHLILCQIPFGPQAVPWDLQQRWMGGPSAKSIRLGIWAPQLHVWSLLPRDLWQGCVGGPPCQLRLLP